MKNFITSILAVVALALGVGMVSTSAASATSSHVLVVDGSQYNSYKESGSAIHWETPDVNPTAASFAERSQTWTGNGADHLPCPHGIHWISNANVLTISHCLDGEETTTTTTAPPTTTTAPEDTTTTAPEVTTTTAVSATTSTAPAETTTTLEAATTLPEVTTTSVEAVTDIGTAPIPSAVPVVTIAPEVLTTNLPSTGTSSLSVFFLALGLIIFGVLMTTIARKANAG